MLSQYVVSGRQGDFLTGYFFLWRGGRWQGGSVRKWTVGLNEKCRGDEGIGIALLCPHWASSPWPHRGINVLSLTVTQLPTVAVTFTESAVCDLSKFSTTTFINFALGASSIVLFIAWPGLKSMSKLYRSILLYFIPS